MVDSCGKVFVRKCSVILWCFPCGINVLTQPASVVRRRVFVVVLYVFYVSLEERESNQTQKWRQRKTEMVLHNTVVVVDSLSSILFASAVRKLVLVC